MIFVLAAAGFGTPAAAQTQCVILLHGLWRTAGSLDQIATDLSERGYHVVNQGYPTTTQPIEQLATDVIPNRIAQCPNDSEINFVTHSLGGILVRSYFAANPKVDRPRAVVMMGPPNQGSEVIDSQIAKSFGTRFTGPVGPQLGAGKSSYVKSLGKVDYPTGVIAGNFSINPAFSMIIPGVDDGAVAVESTKVTGMTDFIELPTNHSFMMNDIVVRNQVIHFLASGKFADNQSPL